MTATTSNARAIRSANNDGPDLHSPAWLAAHRHFLVDLDGTLVRENIVTDGAHDMLRRMDCRYAVVSNNSTDTAHSLSARLRKIGLSVNPGRIVLAGQATIDFLVRTSPAARILLIAGGTLRSYAQGCGCLLVDSDPDLVVLALDKRFSYAKLGAAANALQRGARLVVTNPDMSHPSPDDGLVPETGSLMSAIVQCSGIDPSLVVGKPENMLFVEGLRRLHATAAHTLVIGDNPLTDANGAVRMGMRYLLVGRHELADAGSPAQLLQLAHEGHAHVPAAHRSVALATPLRPGFNTA